jgi:serine/threonine protein kinase
MTACPHVQCKLCLPSLVQDDEPQGTLYYLAPEVLNGAVATRSADIYAFGVLLWQMCTGSQPFAGLQVRTEDIHSLAPDISSFRCRQGGYAILYSLYTIPH